MDGQLNEACQESDLFLEDRLNKGVKLAAEEIEKYSHALDTDGFLSMRLYRNYEDFRRVLHEKITGLSERL